ncbi:Hpt domain-containing protein [uncultured Tateyamaria sp.]|uniref:Hpt domain-containing protein n=1 Tax=uncultured Tateyamaria sp. TaxID=455651 RepID=UPI0026198D17|nr:Hpt domain-containing protein [uncultured Tateyamaria sp.]
MTQPLIDASVLDELSEAMGQDFAAELIATFLNEGPVMLAQLKEAATAEDADAYRRAAHSIKSNAQIFGATALANQARDMELGTLEDAELAVGSLETTYDQTAQALKVALDA